MADMKQAQSASLDHEEKYEQLTREAFIEVDTGRIIDHQAVRAWADSLGTGYQLPIPD